MTTPNLALTELANGQQNYLNANATFAIIDALLQTPVISKTLTTAPGSPANGALYIMAAAWPTVAGSATGRLALYRTGGWIVIIPKDGWQKIVTADGKTWKYNGTTWVDVTPAIAGNLGTASTANLGTGAGEVPTNAQVVMKWDSLLSPAISSGALSLDLTNPAGFSVNLNANVTALTFANAPAGKFVVFAVAFLQDGTGGRTITWPAAVQGSPVQPSPSAGALTIMSFATWDGGATIWQAV